MNLVSRCFRGERHAMRTLIFIRLVVLVIVDCLCFGHKIPAFAQGTPRISALFPAGGQVGTSVDVSIQGADLDGAHTLIIEGESGIVGELFNEGGEIDRTHQELFEQACTQCHELRSPSNRSMTAGQWEAIVDRMINEENAGISRDDRDKIVLYLKSVIEESGKLMARVTIPPNVPFGVREMRVVGKYGSSTAWPFEISQQGEKTEVEPNNSITQPTFVEPPLVINGSIGTNADEDVFQFHVYAGARIIFEVKAFRLNNASQQFFHPTISLLDAGAEELARSNGFYSLDPLIDYTFENDGTYYLCIRDLLYRGSSASVYRLSIGATAYNTYLFPPAGQIGTLVQGCIGGENVPDISSVDSRNQPNTTIDLQADRKPGLKRVRTPYGDFSFIASGAPETLEIEISKSSHSNSNVTVPIDLEGEFLFQVKCAQCHELRSPSDQALTAEEWQATITRMKEKVDSNISAQDEKDITAFVQVELERLSELMAERIQGAQEIGIPGGVSGRISQAGDVDYYKFTVSEAQMLGPWWVIQPFDNFDETGFDVVYPPEVEIDLKKEYMGKRGRTIGWYQSAGTGNTVFSNVPEDDVVGYALTYIDADRERTEILSLGSDDGIKVWVNDRLIWSHHVHRPVRSAEDVIALPLVKGRNKILIKIENGYGPWGFLATLGGYSIDLSAERLGSVLSPALTLLNVEGEILSNNAGIGGGRDARIDHSFSEPGSYILRVEDVTGNGGDSYIYHLSVAPTRPDFNITVTPDNPNIGRGGTAVLAVTVSRKVGFSGEIALQAENLPPGITSSSSGIPKEMQKGLIALTAAADAPLEHRVVQIVGFVKPLTGELVKRTAKPVEVYRLADRDMSVQRSSVVVSVTETPNVILSVFPQVVTIKPETPVALKITAYRKPGLQQILTLSLLGLPPGVLTQSQNTILDRDQTEATIVLLPNIVGSGRTEERQNPFIGRELDVLPYDVVVTASVGQKVIASTPPAKLSIGDMQGKFRK